MKSKKMMAMVLATAMVAGSTATVFAADTDANGATGTGTSYDHVDKEIIAVTLPTTSEVANVFDYIVDPERLIDDAETLPDGTTAVAPNADGVYFKNSSASGSAVDASVTAYSIGGVTTGLAVTVPTTTAANLTFKTIVNDGVDGIIEDGWYEGTDTTNPVTVNIADDGNGSVPTPASGDNITVSPYQAPAGGSGYSSSSDKVPFVGKNSVDVDVTVTAAVTATNADKDIVLVADEDALDAATAPALLMTLKVGTDEVAVTSAGAKASATIEGVPDNFAVTADGSKYVYGIRTDVTTTPLDDWNETTVQLSGKTNAADVPEGTAAMTAPKIDLTWTIAKHAETPETYVNATTVSATSKSLTLTMPEGVTVSTVVLVLNGNNTTLGSGNHYTVSGNTLNIVKYAAGWAGGTIKVTYSDSHVDTLTCE